jgi:selenide,water dikinase
VLSDLYACGVSHCDTMLMILGISLKMTEDERMITTREIIRGFNDTATEAGTSVTGGQTVMNPWPIIGGTATAVCVEGDFIRPVHAVAGDVLVLTKPIGTQIAVNCYEWYTSKRETLDKLVDQPTDFEVCKLYEKACHFMGKLNKRAAELMITHGAHAATDITGFGILGHVDNLAKNQNAAVDFELTHLPILLNALRVDK